VPGDDDGAPDDGAADDGLLGDPERFEPSFGPDVPEVEVPSVSVETDHDDFDADVDPELRRTFWRLVVVFDVALLALSLGPMFVYFRGDWATGGPLLALGAAAFAYGVVVYRRYRDDDDAPDDTDLVGE
jgi:hypothetical protein